jgi:hypothetical protein
LSHLEFLQLKEHNLVQQYPHIHLVSEVRIF